MAVVSLATPKRIPRGTARTMVRLHAPEALSVNLGKARP
jgi:cation/acetate symporter